MGKRLMTRRPDGRFRSGYTLTEMGFNVPDGMNRCHACDSVWQPPVVEGACRRLGREGAADDSSVGGAMQNSRAPKGPAAPDGRRCPAPYPPWRLNPESARARTNSTNSPSEIPKPTRIALSSSTNACTRSRSPASPVANAKSMALAATNGS